VPVTPRHIAELLGVASFAASGVLRAGRKGMDLVGVIAIAVVTSLGGGTLRDLLLDRHPITWVGEPTLLWVCLLASGITLVWIRLREPPHRALLVTDTLGLALFTVTGVQIAEQLQYGGIVAVVMGVMTGSAGGVLRDVLCAEIPMVLLPGRLYVVAAAAGATLYLVAQQAGIERNTASVIGMTTIVILRVIALRWKINAPVPKM